MRVDSVENMHAGIPRACRATFCLLISVAALLAETICQRTTSCWCGVSWSASVVLISLYCFADTQQTIHRLSNEESDVRSQSSLQKAGFQASIHWNHFTDRGAVCLCGYVFFNCVLDTFTLCQPGATVERRVGSIL